MIRKLRIYPDPILRKVATLVQDLDGPFVKFVYDMIQTMRRAKGLGLAAPQVGVSKRVFVVDLRACGFKRGPRTLVAVNPLVIATVGALQVMREEGCLSLPNRTVAVQRDVMVYLLARDIHGKCFQRDAKGLLAAAIQHEDDHLRGKLIIDKLVREA